MNKPVSFEVAKLLQDKGFGNTTFPVKLNRDYYNHLGEFKGDVTDYIKAYSKGENTQHLKTIDAPTIAEVVMWLYEKHGIWISVIKDVDIKWPNDYFNYHILISKGTVQSDIGGTQPNTSTESYEAAIEYALNNLICL